MTRSHTEIPDTTPSSTPALAALLSFLESPHHGPEVPMAEFEGSTHALFAAAEREAIGAELRRRDVDVPAVEVEGRRYRRVVRSAGTYLSSAGRVRVERTLYRAGNGRTICPMELRAGIIEGLWTPLAAKQAAWAVSHLTPGETEELFHQLGSMRPSKSSLDRLPKQLSARWEANRRDFEELLREGESVPTKAQMVAVSLDGVHAPVRAEEGSPPTNAEGAEQTGGTGYREVGCGTITFYTSDGERLRTIRMGRMPQSSKLALKKMLRAELEHVLEQRPDLTVVKIADGAPDNWTFLGLLPPGHMVLDFFHATEQLHSAIHAAYGDDPAGSAQFEKLKILLRDHPDGVAKVIRSLEYLRTKFSRRKLIRRVLGYFRRFRSQMNYAELAANDIPIGSGVQEAACKTLVTQRLKRSGMRWRRAGGQAMLTLRGLIQSDRFEPGWAMLSTRYEAQVELPDNVVQLRPKAA